ncbi:MAG: transcriptional repressor [Clostridiales bacterium]|jgi:Fur family ferric uptake transcriptional regulator|nr:transcriptional repressor [Clostridiales bacterium]
MAENQNGWPVGMAGMKKTRQREAVMGVLERSDAPLCARDICALATGEGGSVGASGTSGAFGSSVTSGASSASGVGGMSGTGGAGEPVWLSTVYRILERLVQNGVARKLSALKGNMALYELRRADHRHYAVCVACRKIIPIANCPMDEFIPKISDGEFRVISHNIEVYGYCGDCGRMGCGESDDCGGGYGSGADGT